MATMILKTCNMFKQEDNKEVWKQRRQSDNSSHESLMAENFITNKPSGLQMSNSNYSYSLKPLVAHESNLFLQEISLNIK